MNLFKKFDNLDKYTKLAIIIILIGAIIRFSLAFMYHVSGDACWHFSVARFMGRNLEIPLHEPLGQVWPFWAPPLYHFLLASTYKIFSFNSDLAMGGMKLISPLLGSLTLIFSYLIIEKLYNKKIAVLGLLFISFLPIHIDYSAGGYIDGTLTFFVILSVYLALHNKIAMSAIAAGIAILTKYNGVFIIPLLLYITYKNNKSKEDLNKKICLIALMPILIGLPWFIRNWIHLGNPIWPFLNFLFGGLAKTSYSAFDISRIFDINFLIYIYLGMFGVPNGDYNNLLFFDMPYLKILLPLWLFGTLIFFLPFILGFFSKNKKKEIVLLWILPYIAVMVLYAVNVSWAVTRFALPAIPAIAIIWAKGFLKINNKLKYFIVIILIISSGLILSEFIKINLAANSWNFYQEDFNWVKEHTEKGAIFMAGGQCLSYNLDRFAHQDEYSNLDKVDYVWVNQNFKLDRASTLNKDLLIKVESHKKIYDNKRTGTKIYKVK